MKYVNAWNSKGNTLNYLGKFDLALEELLQKFIININILWFSIESVITKIYY